MLKYRLLKTLRIFVSLLLLAGFAAGFSSLYGLAANAAKGEFLPALLRTVARLSLISALFFAAIVAVTLLAGRLYCSFCCPLGALQDIASRFGKLITFNKLKYRTLPDFHRMRLLVLVVLACLAVGGWMFPLGLFDPFSLFGRNAAGAGQAAFTLVNNALYRRFEAIQPLSPRPEFPLGLSVLSGAILLGILLAAAWRGRIFCNTLCPVGALLGVLAKRALFPLRLDPEKCKKCGQCVKVCKAGCIDLEAHALDSARCVDCMNCANVCRFGAIGFHRRPGKVEPENSVADAVVSPEAPPPDRERRMFLAAAAASGVAALAAGRLAGTVGKKPAPSGSVPPVMPPGAGNRDEFNRRCTGCGVCIANCTGRTLKPSFLEYGLAGMGQPRLSFEVGKCEYECAKCSKLCPTGALRNLSLEEKRRCRIGEVRYFWERCVVVNDGTSCGACAEHCPTGALQMVPFIGNLTIPQVISDLCIGCGSCQYICPAVSEAGKAVMVYGASRQTRAADPRIALKPAQPTSAEMADFPF